MTSVGQKECRSEAGVKLIYRKVMDGLLMHLLMFDICNILLASSLNCVYCKDVGIVCMSGTYSWGRKKFSGYFLDIIPHFFCRGILLRGGGV